MREEREALAYASTAELKQARVELEDAKRGCGRLAQTLISMQRARCDAELFTGAPPDARRLAAVELEEVAERLHALNQGLMVGWAADCALYAAHVLRKAMANDGA